MTSIGERAFEGCTGLSVSIPSKVISIGIHAFNQCKGLASVTISAGVGSILLSALQQVPGTDPVTTPVGLGEAEGRVNSAQELFHRLDDSTDFSLAEVGGEFLAGLEFAGIPDEFAGSILGVGKTT